MSNSYRGGFCGESIGEYLIAHQRAYPTLRKQKSAVAKVILADPQEAVHYSITELAKMAK